MCPWRLSWPADRLNYILESERIVHVVTEPARLDALPPLDHVVCLDGEMEALSPVPLAGPEDLGLHHLHLGLHRPAQGGHGPPPPGGQPRPLGQPPLRGRSLGHAALRHRSLVRPVGLRHLRHPGGRRAPCGSPPRRAAGSRGAGDASSWRSRSPSGTRRPRPFSSSSRGFRRTRSRLPCGWSSLGRLDPRHPAGPGAPDLPASGGRQPGRRHRGHDLVQLLPGGEVAPALGEHPLWPADRQRAATTCSTPA